MKESKQKKKTERNNIISKRKKPEFLRQNWFRYSKLGYKWRKPRGKQSKMRQHIKGKRKSPSPGYGSPRDIRGNVHGFRIAYVESPGDLNKIDNTSAIVLSSRLGGKKIMQIKNQTDLLGLKILNRSRIERIKKMLAMKEIKKKESLLREMEKTRKEKESAEEKKEESKKQSEKRSSEENIETLKIQKVENAGAKQGV